MKTNVNSFFFPPQGWTVFHFFPFCLLSRFFWFAFSPQVSLSTPSTAMADEEAQCDTSELKVVDVTDEIETLRQRQTGGRPAGRTRKKTRMMGCFEQIPFKELLDFRCRKTIDIVLTEQSPQARTTRCGVRASQELAQFVFNKAGVEYTEQDEVFVCFEYKKKSMTSENKNRWIFCISNTVLLEKRNKAFLNGLPIVPPDVDDDMVQLLYVSDQAYEPPAKQPRQETMIVYAVLAWLEQDQGTNKYFLLTDEDELGALFDRGSEEFVRYEKAQKDWKTTFPNLDFVNVCFSFLFPPKQFGVDSCPLKRHTNTPDQVLISVVFMVFLCFFHVFLNRSECLKHKTKS